MALLAKGKSEKENGGAGAAAFHCYDQDELAGDEQACARATLSLMRILQGGGWGIRTPSEKALIACEAQNVRQLSISSQEICAILKVEVPCILNEY